MMNTTFDLRAHRFDICHGMYFFSLLIRWPCRLIMKFHTRTHVDDAVIIIIRKGSIYTFFSTNKIRVCLCVSVCMRSYNREVVAVNGWNTIWKCIFLLVARLGGPILARRSIKKVVVAMLWHKAVGLSFGRN